MNTKEQIIEEVFNKFMQNNEAEEAQVMAHDVLISANKDAKALMSRIYDRIMDILPKSDQPTDNELEVSPFGPHTHIPIAGGKGHVTWHGEEPPSKEIMNAFEEIAKRVQNQPTELPEVVWVQEKPENLPIREGSYIVEFKQTNKYPAYMDHLMFDKEHYNNRLIWENDINWWLKPVPLSSLQTVSIDEALRAARKEITSLQREVSEEEIHEAGMEHSTLATFASNFPHDKPSELHGFISGAKWMQTKLKK